MPRQEIKPLEMDPDTEAWERQPTETLKRFAQFALYRDMGRARTLRRVADTLTLNAGYVRQVATSHKWTTRCEAYDLHLDALHRANWLEDRRKALQADMTTLNALLVKVGQGLRNLKAEEMDAPTLIRALDVAMRHRRLLFGDPTEKVEVGAAGDSPAPLEARGFSDLPADARDRAIQQLLDDIARRRRASADTDADE